jgi:arabinofuranosyltransferase
MNRPLYRSRSIVAVGALLAAELCLLLPYRLAYSDDALISWRYLDRLLAGKGLTWNDGEAVEGYSNLLWILVILPWRSYGFEVIEASQYLGGLLGLISTALLFFAFASTVSGAARWLGTALVVLSPTFLNWSIAGLEQPLLGALVSTTLFSVIRAMRAEPENATRWLRTAMACSIGMTLTRPDGGLFSVGIGLGLVWASAQFRRPGFLITILSFIAFGAQTWFRVAYYGAWTPNTATVKLSFDWSSLISGVRYFGLGSLRFALPMILGALGAVSWWRRERAVRVLLAPIGFWCAYLCFAGGDINWLWRHFYPVIVILGFLAVLGIETLFSLRGARSLKEWGIVVPGLVICSLGIQWGEPEARAARGQGPEGVDWITSVDRVRPIALGLKNEFSHARPLIAVENAGALPYFTNFRAIDTLGLNDRFIAKNPSSRKGSGWLGHDVGNPRYVLDRAPDIIFFCNYGHPTPCFSANDGLVDDPRFRDEYALARRMFPGASRPSVFWIRKSFASRHHIDFGKATLPPSRDR